MLICLLMDSVQIAELLVPFTGGAQLSVFQLEQLSLYLDLLMRWNARTNLTAVREEKSIVLRHFGESVFVTRCLFAPDSAESVIDVGSGAGFPGIPIKICSPGVNLTLIESQNKKATFLKEVARWTRLQGVAVFHGRAEAFSGKADVVTLRAVEQFEEVLPVAGALISEKAESRIAMLVGEGQVQRAKELLPRLKWHQPVPIPLSSARVVLMGSRAACE